VLAGIRLKLELSEVVDVLIINSVLVLEDNLVELVETLVVLVETLVVLLDVSRFGVVDVERVVLVVFTP